MLMLLSSLIVVTMSSSPLPNKEWRSKVASIDLKHVALVRFYGENLSRPEWSGLSGSRTITSLAEIGKLHLALTTSERVRGTEPPENMSYGDYICFEYSNGQPSVRLGMNRFSLRDEHGAKIEAAMKRYWTTVPIKIPPHVKRRLEAEAKRLSKLLQEAERNSRRRRKAE